MVLVIKSNINRFNKLTQNISFKGWQKEKIKTIYISFFEIGFQKNLSN